MAVANSKELILLSNNYKNKIYVSLDIKDNIVMVRGWKEKSEFKVEEILKIYNSSSIKGYVITDIENDGMLNGLNTVFLNKIIDVIEKNNPSNKSFILAGGLTNYQDLNKLKKLQTNNLEGIISGKSFYVGNIDIKKGQKILDS